MTTVGLQASPTIPAAAAVENPRDFWSRLTPQHQDHLTRNRGGKTRSFLGDRPIPLSGTQVAIVQNGWVRSGGENSPLRMYGEGEVIGVSALLGSPRVDYSCPHTYVELLILPADQFSSFLHASRHYLTLMAAEESRRAEADRLRALTGSAAHRLAAFFIELTRPEHQPYIPRNGPMIVMPFQGHTQQDLAAFSGMSLRSLQRGLAELEGRNIISFDWSGARILDRDALYHAAGIKLPATPATKVLQAGTPVPI